MAGKPKSKIDWKIVEKLLEADCEGTEIAAYIGVHPNTLYERCKKEKNCNFSEYLQEKKAKGNSLLKVKQYEAAVKDKDKSMMIWLGKQRLGQKDKHEVESTNINIDNLSDKSTDELINRAKAIKTINSQK